MAQVLRRQSIVLRLILSPDVHRSPHWFRPAPEIPAAASAVHGAAVSADQNAAWPATEPRQPRIPTRALFADAAAMRGPWKSRQYLFFGGRPGIHCESAVRARTADRPSG